MHWPLAEARQLELPERVALQVLHLSRPPDTPRKDTPHFPPPVAAPGLHWLRLELLGLRLRLELDLQDWLLELDLEDWRLQDWRLQDWLLELELEDWRLELEDWRLQDWLLELELEDWRLEDWLLELELELEDWGLEDWLLELELELEDWGLEDWLLELELDWLVLGQRHELGDGLDVVHLGNRSWQLQTG